MISHKEIQDRKARKKLRKTLSKLNIKSAQIERYSIEYMMGEIVFNTLENFGKPDQLLMNPRDFEILKKTLKT